jgi:arginine decarboxylase
VEDAQSLFGLKGWSDGYFGISPRGTLLAYPQKDPSRSVDLFELVEGLRERDLGSPVLIRFSDILADRMSRLRGAFDDAMAEAEYGGGYTCVYPIKVNQQRHVCEAIRDLGATLGFGLEVGTKPELLAVLALTRGHNEMPIVCNGFKDAEFLEIVTLAAKLGRNVLPVVEQYGELELILEQAERFGVEVPIGIRAKLSSSGIGRWEASAGMRGKFGLTASEILSVLRRLREAGKLDSLRMLHAHVGSQLFNIRTVKDAVTELGHVYTELVRLGAPMGMIDLGGGLGVDYDGSQSATESSVNYTTEEYARDVVHRLKAICDEAGVPYPHIVTESGRAMVAHSSVLVCDVVGSRTFIPLREPADLTREVLRGPQTPQPILDLVDAHDRVREGDPLEVYHDAAYAREQAIQLFGLGHMSLPDRAAVEELFWAVGQTLLSRFAGELPEDLESLPLLLSDIYFCNFSLFQSLPDSWAIDQLFPIVPIHRLDEAPSRNAVLADITCDSDGKIDRFADPVSEKRVLEVHPLIPSTLSSSSPYQPYYLGIFLVGAYQETLGDLHNLLGDTHAVHVRLDADGQWEIEEIVEGDSVKEVLGYVQFDVEGMRRAVRMDIEEASRRQRLTLAEGRILRRSFEEGLEGYTYVER